MNYIPHIIHQIWSGIDDPLPAYFKRFGETWKTNHPNWKYEFWDNDRINKFILEYYPQHWNTYNEFTYNIQRWDAIRYLILDKIGGMYVDFDTECLEPFDSLIINHSCCFSLEYTTACHPKYRLAYGNKDYFFNNALMASIPNHPFMKVIIENVFSYNKKLFEGLSKKREVAASTGPSILMKLYENYSDKELICLIPAEFVSPFLKDELIQVYKGIETEELNKRLQKAYCVHYFFNTWI
jgi:mannosyltransferase OCH1-like enzyme